MRELKVGDIVKLTVDLLGNESGTEGVVYEVYRLDDKLETAPGVSVIFPNGEYDGFSINEQKQFLERIGHEPVLSGYEFKSVMQLVKDFDAGVFDVVFQN